jgi:hypothetical protein
LVPWQLLLGFKGVYIAQFYYKNERGGIRLTFFSVDVDSGQVFAVQKFEQMFALKQATLSSLLLSMMQLG